MSTGGTDNSEDSSGSNQEMGSIAVKLPPFWPKMPSAWFIYCESQFATRKIIREKTKYNYIISSLTEDTIMSVFDIIQQISESADTDHPHETPYTIIKNALIERHSLSESSRIETLLQGEEIGDRKPSEFFRYLKTLAGTSDLVTDKLIMNLWTRRLPSMVQATLKAVSKETGTSELLSMADNVFEVVKQQNVGIFQVSGSSSGVHGETMQGLIDKNTKLESEISEIKSMISNLKVNSHSNRFRSRSRSRNRNSSKQYCFYHFRFGNKAKKCSKPCSYSQQHPNK